ncbi:MAG: FAD-dependent oxidoreductase [Pseudomonadota bacterium]
MSQSTDRAEHDVPPWAAGAAQRMHELDPSLSDSEIDIVRRYGEEATFNEGDLLWRAGDIAIFMLVLEGQIDVHHNDDQGERVIISHGPRHYIGEIVTMSGGQALVSGRASAPLRALVLQPDAVRSLIATEPELGEKILLSFILRRMRMVAERLANVQLIGDQREADCLVLESFLSRNGIPFDLLDTGASVTPRLDATITRHSLTRAQLPAVVVNERVLERPTTRHIAEALGFTVQIDCGTTYDVAVVGSGPAGLTAAVYAASEGLSVLVLENCAPGGQAASSSRIENYMGFPTGISGQGLMGRAYLQAQKFGAKIAVARELLTLEPAEPLHKLHIDGGDTVFARSVVLASGAIYRQPQIEGLDQLGGIHYGASHVEGELCRGRDVAVVGGGNSAGQAAMYLSTRARHVHIWIRGKDLTHSMSSYLIDRIEKSPNVTLHSHTEIEKLEGDSRLDGVVVKNNQTGETRRADVSNLFIFIGAQPGTSFVPEEIAKDARGFVLTGDDLDAETLSRCHWSEDRKPYLLETSCPRIFAAGDVRSGSVKRVASAVGEGSVCIQFVHRVLADAT